jgi:hypothetical protein
VPGLAGPDRQPDREMGLAGAGRPEEDHVVAGGGEVQGAQVGDDLAFERTGVVEVELLQALAGREAGGADAALPAVGLAGGDLTLQAGEAAHAPFARWCAGMASWLRSAWLALGVLPAGPSLEGRAAVAGRAA